MLRQRAAAVAALSACWCAIPQPAWAADRPTRGGTVVCPQAGGDCIVAAHSPGRRTSHPSRIRPSRPGRCSYAGQAWNCIDPLLGWFDGKGCYWSKAEPQPAPADPIWAGHYPRGTVYQVVCLGPDGTAVPGTGGGWQWRPAPPPGLDRARQAAELAADAASRLRLRGPDIHTSVRPGGTGLVGLPVWLWTTVTPRTWGTATTTATVPGLAVTATARPVQITYDMGDGTTVTCRGPGTPYRPSYGGSPSPTCAHTYTRSSAGQPGERYTITGTTTWQVRWTGGGQSGDIPVRRRSSTTIRIGEIQVLVR